MGHVWKRAWVAQAIAGEGLTAYSALGQKPIPMKNSIRVLLFVMTFVLLLPQATYAAWWNPFTWNILNNKVDQSLEVSKPTEVIDYDILAKKFGGVPADKAVPPQDKKTTQHKTLPSLPKSFIPDPISVRSLPTQTWEEIEEQYFTEAIQKGWPALTLTNSLGQKRYYYFFEKWNQVDSEEKAIKLAESVRIILEYEKSQERSREIRENLDAQWIITKAHLDEQKRQIQDALARPSYIPNTYSNPTPVNSYTLLGESNRSSIPKNYEVKIPNIIFGKGQSYVDGGGITHYTGPNGYSGTSYVDGGGNTHYSDSYGNSASCYEDGGGNTSCNTNKGFRTTSYTDGGGNTNYSGSSGFSGTSYVDGGGNVNYTDNQGNRITCYVVGGGTMNCR